jgi:hypothetical protein
MVPEGLRSLGSFVWVTELSTPTDLSTKIQQLAVLPSSLAPEVVPT